jgi:dihydroorotase
VTCEVTPHHFVLTDEMLAAPVARHQHEDELPLRGADRDAMLQGLADSIDVIATDHARTRPTRSRSSSISAVCITGLETAVSLCLDRLIHRGIVTLPRLIELLSVNPAKILNVPGGLLPKARYRHHDPRARSGGDGGAAQMKSKSKNTPFDGWQLRGGVADYRRGGGRERAAALGCDLAGLKPKLPVGQGLYCPKEKMDRRAESRERALKICSSSKS